MKKTKVCIDCKKRKKVEEFYEQKGQSTKKHYRGDGRRRECKSCHYLKSRKSLLANTTREQRRKYMGEYMKIYRK